MEIKTIEDAFKYIISKHGISVFNEDGRLIALLADYAPALKREYSLIKIAVNAGVYGQLYEARELPSKEQIYISINVFISCPKTVFGRCMGRTGHDVGSEGT